MDVGAELRQAREQRGLSLHDLSHRTKITLPALRAIEANDIKRLPGGIFTRGFLKAYAREVGLDPDDISARYTAQFAPPPPPPEPPAEVVPPAAVLKRPTPREASYPVERGRALTAIVALALLAALYFASGRWLADSGPSAPAGMRPSGARPVATRGASQQRLPEARAATGTTGSVTVASSRAAPDTVMRVDLQPPDLCWVSATADGRRVMYRLMNAGERETIDVRSELVLRVGDPARFGYSINGSAGKPLGRPGQPATVRLTVQNYRAFLGQ